MPFKAPKLKEETIAAIGTWIDLGAPYDKPLADSGVPLPRAVVTAKEREFWSFRPLANVEPPSKGPPSPLPNRPPEPPWPPSPRPAPPLCRGAHHWHRHAPAPPMYPIQRGATSASQAALLSLPRIQSANPPPHPAQQSAHPRARIFAKGTPPKRAPHGAGRPRTRPLHRLQSGLLLLHEPLRGDELWCAPLRVFERRGADRGDPQRGVHTRSRNGSRHARDRETGRYRRETVRQSGRRCSAVPERCTFRSGAHPTEWTGR